MSTENNTEIVDTENEDTELEYENEEPGFVGTFAPGVVLVGLIAAGYYGAKKLSYKLAERRLAKQYENFDKDDEDDVIIVDTSKTPNRKK